MRTSKDDPELTSQSAHLLFALRDMLGMQFSGLDKASNQFVAAIEAKGGSVDHDPFGGEA